MPMDKLAERLREDAARIEVTVAPDLEARIRASLEGVAEEQRQPVPRRPKSFGLWWLSTLTGAMLAAALIVALNLWPSATEQGVPPAEPPAMADLAIPPLPLRLQPAVLTRPLEEEYELLQSDLEKAGATVKDSLDRLEQVF